MSMLFASAPARRKKHREPSPLGSIQNRGATSVGQGWPSNRWFKCENPRLHLLERTKSAAQLRSQSSASKRFAVVPIGC